MLSPLPPASSSPSPLCFALCLALAAGSGGLARAQDTAPPGATAPAEPMALLPLSTGRVGFSADSLDYDPQADRVIARGNVRLEREGYVLRAGRLVWDRAAGRVVAQAGVRLETPEGTVIAARSLDLQDTLRQGSIEDLTLVLEEGARARAADAVRGPDGRTRLTKASYSPCNVCAEAGQTDTPLWRIRAVRVIHDAEKQRLFYKNAVFEVVGVPIAFTPYFSHPAPGVERATGFLVPEFRQREDLGLVAELPFHWVLSPSQDLTFTGIATTREGAVGAVEYRRHVGFGEFDFGGSVTYDSDAEDEAGLPTGDGEVRGHVFSNGRFRVSPHWRFTHQLQFVSDDTFLRRFGFTNADTLVNDVNLEGFYGRSYVSVRSLAFQGLRIEDDPGLTPFAAPLIEAEWVSRPGLLGGTVSASGRILELRRTAGQDARRFSGQIGYFAPYTTPMGQIVEVEAQLRGDLYQVRDSESADVALFAGENGTGVRGIPRLGVTLRWPFARPGPVTQIVEPIVQAVAAPSNLTPAAIPIEDGRAVELTAVNLFDLDRVPGEDLVESGSRLTYGLRYRLTGASVSLDALFGQSLLFNGVQDPLLQAVGLDGDFSDFAARLRLGLGERLNLSYRAQLDDSSFLPLLTEVEGRYDGSRVGVSLGYLRVKRGLLIDARDDREEIRLASRIGITKNWAIGGDFIRDLTEFNPLDTIEWGVGLFYNNECVEISVGFRENNTQDRDVEPGTSVNFEIRLISLG